METFWIVATCVATVGIVIIALATRRTLRISLGKGKVLTLGGEPEEKDHCALCQKRTEERLTRIFTLKQDLMHRQLKLTENALKRINALLADAWAQFLVGQGQHEDPRSLVGYDRYLSKVAEFCSTKALPGFRQVFRENGLGEMNAEQWARHKGNVLAVVQGDIQLFAASEYAAVPGVSREDCLAFHKTNWPAVSTILAAMLDEARDLAIDAHAAADRIRKEAV